MGGVEQALTGLRTDAVVWSERDFWDLTIGQRCLEVTVHLVSRRMGSELCVYVSSALGLTDSSLNVYTRSSR